MKPLNTPYNMPPILTAPLPSILTVHCRKRKIVIVHLASLLLALGLALRSRCRTGSCRHYTWCSWRRSSGGSFTSSTGLDVIECLILGWVNKASISRRISPHLHTILSLLLGRCHSEDTIFVILIVFRLTLALAISGALWSGCVFKFAGDCCK
jgi:hypothetical protein